MTAVFFVREEGKKRTRHLSFSGRVICESHLIYDIFMVVIYFSKNFINFYGFFFFFNPPRTSVKKRCNVTSFDFEHNTRLIAISRILSAFCFLPSSYSFTLKGKPSILFSNDKLFSYTPSVITKA